MDLRDAPEFQQGLPPSFPSWQTGPLKINDSPFEVIAQFAVQTALQLLATEPVRELPYHLVLSLKMSCTAPAKRAQVCFSAASCFRPEAVNE